MFKNVSGFEPLEIRSALQYRKENLLLLRVTVIKVIVTLIGPLFVFLFVDSST